MYIISLNKLIEYAVVAFNVFFFLANTGGHTILELAVHSKTSSDIL
jgi:hypothetical protein